MPMFSRYEIHQVPDTGRHGGSRLGLPCAGSLVCGAACQPCLVAEVSPSLRQPHFLPSLSTFFITHLNFRFPSFSFVFRSHSYSSQEYGANQTKPNRIEPSITGSPSFLIFPPHYFSEEYVPTRLLIHHITISSSKINIGIKTMPPSTHITVSVHSHTQPSYHTSSSSPSPQCLKYTSFMHGLTPGWALFLTLLFGLLSILFTNATRWSTPGICDEPKSKPDVVDAVGAAQDPEIGPSACPLRTECPSGGVKIDEEGERETDAPPPYQPAASISAPEPAPQPQPQTEPHTWMNPKKPPIKFTSAHRFVAGTFFFLLTLTSLILAGLSIQAATLCHPDGEFGTLGKVFCEYSIPFLSFSVSSYPLLNIQIPTIFNLSSS